MSECGFRIERGSYFLGPCRREEGHDRWHSPMTDTEVEAERQGINRYIREQTGYGFDAIVKTTDRRTSHEDSA